MQGVMKCNVELLGTSLKLQAGQRVRLTPATNLPQGGYFAAPSDGKWSDGIERCPEDSILVTADDVTPADGV